MGFWIFMLAADLLIPAAMLIFGGVFVLRPPKKIQPIYGYRSAMSMKNQDTWDFAHRYFGRLWLYLGLGLLLPSAATLAAVCGSGETEVGTVGGMVCAVQVAVMIAGIFPTEAALRRRFDENGRRREKGTHPYA